MQDGFGEDLYAAARADTTRAAYAADWDDFCRFCDRFRLEPLPVGRGLGAALPDLSVLLLVLSGSLVGSYAAFRRYDPR